MTTREAFIRRLKKLRKRHDLKQPEMGYLFGVGHVMYQKIESGRYMPQPETMERYLELLDKYEKETDLTKYFSGIPKGTPTQGGGSAQDQVVYLIEENKTLRDEIRSLKFRTETDQTTIRFLYEQINELKKTISDERAKRHLNH